MKKIILLILAVMTLSTVCRAQQDPYQDAAKALKNKEFYIQCNGNSLTNEHTLSVNERNYYISVNGKEADIQIPGHQYKATISNSDIKVDKKGNITFKMYIVHPTGTNTITILMDKKKNSCKVLSNPFRAGGETYAYGNVYPLEKIKQGKYNQELK